MSLDATLEIFAWVGLAFAAGFIGYFGKHLGKETIAKFRKDSSDVEKSVETSKEDLKLRKKQLKLEKKNVKKE